MQTRSVSNAGMPYSN